MDTKFVTAVEPGGEDGTASLLWRFLSVRPADPLELRERWCKGFNDIFIFMTKSASRFFVSLVKSEEVSRIQSVIHCIFRKTDYVEKIKDNCDLQNAFLLGYCHGIDQMIDSFESETSYQKNDSLKSAIESYKYVEPILRILDQEFELSHKELAERIGIGEPALSNFMKSVQKYHLFNATHVGKNKFYSLAHPNGEEALKIVKESNRISADGYTEFLLEMINSLINISTCDDVEKDNVLKKCDKMFLQYTTKPALCRKKLEELIFFSKSERVYYIFLVDYEKRVEQTVTVFTRDFRSEKKFYHTIAENISKNIVYQWFITETDELNIEKVKNAFLQELLQCTDLGDGAAEKFEHNILCHIISKEETDRLLGNIYDAVIYDGNDGFSCMDTTITDKTPYFHMPSEKVAVLIQYANSYYPTHTFSQQY